MREKHPTYGTLTHRVKHLKAELAEANRITAEMYHEYNHFLDQEKQAHEETKKAMGSLVADMIEAQRKELERPLCSMVDDGHVHATIERDEYVRGERFMFTIQTADMHRMNAMAQHKWLQHAIEQASMALTKVITKSFIRNFKLNTTEVPLDNSYIRPRDQWVC